MTPKERICVAMKLGVPDQVPVMCQMSTGHILLNSGIDPVAETTDSTSYAESLWRMRELYDFDGILMHKPGREPGWLDDCKQRQCDNGTEFVFDDGSYVRVQRDDDPIFFPSPDFEYPDIDEIDVANPLYGHFGDSFIKWHRFKDTHDYRKNEDIPEYWYGCIDYLLAKSQDRYSLHGETRSPFDHVLNLLGSQSLMMALITHADKVHKLMEWATRAAVVWSVAQVGRGCGAIKVSSPWVGGGFISPKAYREFVVPYERQLAGEIRQAGGFVYTHTCGAIADRLEDMMATGINGIECLDPPPLGNIELADAVARTKGRIFIKGNIDSVNTLLKKDAAGVRADVKRTVEIAAPGGGYICSTACSISPRVKPENIRVMVEAAREFGF